MSYADEDCEPTTTTVPSLLSERERALLAQASWSTDQLVELAFLARRLADRIERELRRGGE